MATLAAHDRVLMKRALLLCRTKAHQAKHLLKTAHLVNFVTDGLAATAAPDACHHDNPCYAENARGLDHISVPRIVYALVFVAVRDSSKGRDGSVAAVQNSLDTLEVQRVTDNRRYACEGGTRRRYRSCQTTATSRNVCRSTLRAYRFSSVNKYPGVYSCEPGIFTNLGGHPFVI